MEHIMNSLLPRKFQFLCLLPNRIEYLERLKELCLQIVVMLGLDIFAFEPNFVIRDIASRLNAFVVGPLLEFLGVVEVFLANNYQLS